MGFSLSAHAQKDAAGKFDDPACRHAAYGKLDVNFLNKRDLSKNAYFLSCALAPVVLEPMDNRSSWRNLMQAKQKLADTLLRFGVDTRYAEEDGSTLLMTVILSPLPERWKERTVRVLVERGADPDRKNGLGNTALDYARYKHHRRIAGWLVRQKRDGVAY